MSIRRALTALSALALAACVGPALIKRDFDPAVNFWKMHTYAWAPAAPEPAGKDIVVATDTLLRQRVVAAVDDALRLKGYPSVDAAQADFWVTYHVAMTRRQEAIIYNNYYGAYGGWGGRGGWGRYNYYYPMGLWMGPPETMVREYDERTLALDLLDPKTRKLVWRATARNYEDDNATPQQKAHDIAATVREMLKEFPPLFPPR